MGLRLKLGEWMVERFELLRAELRLTVPRQTRGDDGIKYRASKTTNSHKLSTYNTKTCVIYIFVGYPSQHSGNTNFKTCYWMRRAFVQLLNRSYPNAKRSSGVRDALSPNQSKSSMIDFSALPVAQSETPKFKQCMEHHFTIWTLKQGSLVSGPRTLVRKRMEITRMSLLKNAL